MYITTHIIILCPLYIKNTLSAIHKYSYNNTVFPIYKYSYNIIFYPHLQLTLEKFEKLSDEFVQVGFTSSELLEGESVFIWGKVDSTRNLMAF